MLAQCQAALGPKRLRSLHVNDSAQPLGSNRDRHANLGEGELADKGCAVFLSEPRFEDLPCVLETPGVDRSGVRAEDVALANRLRKRGLAARGRARRQRDGAPGVNSPAAPPALEVTALQKRYRDVVALGGVELTVARGELVGLLGPNGAGKSTLVKIACGLVRPSAGSVQVCGSPAGSRPARATLGYLAELFRFPGWCRATEVLELHQRLAGSRRRPS